MAITKIHPIKATVSSAINYICNEKKTDGKVLISSFGCSPESAANDFKFTLSHTKQSDPNKAFHLIQSFAPGEVTPEVAHAIGVELADRLLQGKYSYVVATHIDHDHIHNHLIFCAADNIDYQKYHDCKSSYYHIRNLSDELCAENNLSIIKESNNIGKSYKEWMEEKKGTSWKTKLKQDINSAIKQSHTYDEFIKIMQENGYQLKDAGLGPDNHKYISFLPPGKERWIRGREKSLGKDFTKERIKERIEEKAKIRAERMQRFIHPSRKLIDTSDSKFEENSGLKHWAERENLKRAAAIYAELGKLGLQSMDELDDKISSLHDDAKSGKKTVIALEKEIKSFSEIVKFARQYEENKKYEFHYKKSKDPERYYREHSDQLALVWGAKDILENAGINPKSINLHEIENHLKELTERHKKLSNQYRSADKEFEKLVQLRDSLNSFMKDEPSQEQERQNKKSLE